VLYWDQACSPAHHTWQRAWPGEQLLCTIIITSPEGDVLVVHPAVLHHVCHADIATSLHCRPAVVASYAVSSISAVASALCYAEYAVDFPIAGGGYGFVSLTYGEFIGW
jgi:hypothetical protein